MIRVDAEIAGPSIRAQLRSNDLPTPGEILRHCDRYYLGYTALTEGAPFQVRIGESDQPRSCGSIVLLAPDIPIFFRHKKWSQPFLVCSFQPPHFEEVTGITQRLNENELAQCLDLRRPQLASTMARIHRELLQPGFASQLVIEANGTLLLVEVARYLHEIRGQRGDDHARTGGLAQWQLRRILERIEDLLGTGTPTVKELAALCGMSQAHLMRGFKMSTGATIYKHIEDARLRTAKELLTADQMSTKEIALRLGFSSPAYFSSAFRRLTEMTPTEYKKLTRRLAS